MLRYVYTPLSLLLFFCASLPSNAFYLPGVAPRDYLPNDKVELLVNTYTSRDTAIPYDFYNQQFHNCEPDGGPRTIGESLGSILFGDRLYSSRFDLRMVKDTACNKLCSAPVVVSAEDGAFINQRIKEQYAHNWVVDGLPAGRQVKDSHTLEPYYEIGFPIGTYYKEQDRAVFHNHFDIEILYHNQDAEKYRVVGVLVHPSSILHFSDSTCAKGTLPLTLAEDSETRFEFTYNVYWVPSTKQWGTRWDEYLHVQDPKIHWFSLINSIVVVLFLSGMVAVVLLRVLHRDIARYNAADAEDAQEEFGWKLVHGDVFRPPRGYLWLAVLVGNGAQLAAMAGVTLVFAVLGFLSPSSRGSLSTVMLVFYVFFGSVAGYVSARAYKMWGGEEWKKNVLLTAIFVPGIVFLIYVILNFFLIAAKSSGAVPFGTVVALIAMWFGVSVPLCLVGAYFGFKQPRIDQPVRTNQIPRQIPDLPSYLRPAASVLMAGILPFAAVFIELFFIMSSIWNHRIYYVFGFLGAVGVVLTVTCSEVAVLMCYFQLCAEDYNWWWRSFLASGSSAFYVLLYSVYYYYKMLTFTSFTSGVLYFGYMLIGSGIFFVLTGTIGVVACFVFVRQIYASIKID
ncbi:hypothetical protein M427DRAFT_62914 [Gonapodya prolifera JEL478]|uniref:Transmembrane 9 superfamily member n=1 Tax=Gonapodya prolifera (strain JEL478) TaxID=1344416 RepID=A0A139A0M8_GONPJ|nr:hypothetical protein M427DRAFT_62914 [Gonapodya prolifera JEL478]|eukprot:KXS10178.1 hypothetical protein M427DRAFT_62914 [Gonapodya prolifera JEL478]